MKETKLKVNPMFLRPGETVTQYEDGLTSFTLVGYAPKGGRVVLQLKDMTPSMLKQFIKESLKSLRVHRDRALANCDEMKFEANR